MTTWAQGTTRGDRHARVTALEHDNYQCQRRADGCTLDAATAITTDSGKLTSVCPNCLEAPQPPRRRPRKRTT